MSHVIETVRNLAFYNRSFFRDVPFKNYFPSRLALKLEDEVPSQYIYTLLFKEVVAEHIKLKDSLTNELQESKKRGQALEEEAREKQERIEELKKTDVVSQLQEQVSQQRRELEELKGRNKEANETIEGDLALIEKQKNEIKELLRQVEKKKGKAHKNLMLLRQSEVVIGNKEREIQIKDEKIEKLSKMLIAVRESFDKSLVQLSVVKDLMMKMKHELERVKGERDTLSQRVAIGFDSLTPRPNLKESLEKNDLVRPPRFSFQKKEQEAVSTSKILEEILKEFRQMEIGKSGLQVSGLRHNPIQSSPNMVYKKKSMNSKTRANLFGTSIKDFDAVREASPRESKTKISFAAIQNDPGTHDLKSEDSITENPSFEEEDRPFKEVDEVVQLVMDVANQKKEIQSFIKDNVQSESDFT